MEQAAAAMLRLGGRSRSHFHEDASELGEEGQKFRRRRLQGVGRNRR